MDYAEGDKVRILGRQYPGTMPEVGSIGTYMGKDGAIRPHRVLDSETRISWYYHDDEIEPVEPRFQVGDKVRTKVGTVVNAYPATVAVKFAASTRSLLNTEVELVERAPQPRFKPGDKIKVGDSKMLRVVVRDDGKTVYYVNVDAVNLTAKTPTQAGIFPVPTHACELAE